MNDHNLDDLILDNIEPERNKKSNSFLTMVALSIIVLIIAIILTKVVLRDPEIKQLRVEQNDTELVSPDLTLQPIDEEKSEIDAPIPEPSSEEKVVKKAEESVLEPATTPEVKEETDVQPVVSSEPKPQPAEEPVKKEPKKEVKKSKEIPKTVQVPEKTIEKATQEPNPRPANVLTRPGEKSTYNNHPATSAFYIQVGSFKYDPGKKFIGKLKKNGLQYKVIKSKSGIKKLLVGPYPDRQSVDKALIQVRKQIAKDAFVYKK